MLTGSLEMTPHAPLTRQYGERHRTVGMSGVHISQSEAHAKGEGHRQRLRRGRPRRDLEATRLGRQAERMRSVAFRWSGFAWIIGTARSSASWEAVKAVNGKARSVLQEKQLKSRRLTPVGRPEAPQGRRFWWDGSGPATVGS